MLLIQLKQLWIVAFFRILWTLLFATFLNERVAQASILYESQPFPIVDPYGLSPFWEWKTIETENFRIHFPNELAEVAQKSATYLEETHTFLTPILLWTPRLKTNVVLLDNQDQANGLTAPLGRLGMILWATLPNSESENAVYDNWLRTLVIHEYTHFLNMDATRGVWTPLRYVFGDVFLPNSIWQPWMLEGLAVTTETRFTLGGRGRSVFYDMILRAATLEGVLDSSLFVTLDRMNGENPYYPGGNTRYIFGYHLIKEVPVEKLGLLSFNSSARIPFFINENLKNTFGQDWYSTWDQWQTKVRMRAESELTQIQSQPTNIIIPLTEKNHWLSNDISGIAASPNGKWIAFTRASTEARQGLYLLDPSEKAHPKTIHRLGDKLTGIGMKFTPDSKTLIYSRLRRRNPYEFYSDLEAYHLPTQSRYWLTTGSRFRDPDVSADGQWIVFMFTEKSVTGLGLAPLIEAQRIEDTGEKTYYLGPIQKIYTPPLYDHVANPRFSADGKKIYFSYHPNGKSQENICVIDRQSKNVEALVADGFYNRFPIVDSHGELFYISNKTGTDNLVQYSSKSLFTNMETGIAFPIFHSPLNSPLSSPVRSKDVLYANVLTTQGWSLSQIQPLENPVDDRQVTLATPPLPEGTSHTVSQKAATHYPVQDYSVFPSILPRLWTPLLGLDSYGINAGGELLGFDATDRHRYILAGSYQTALAVGDAYAHYSSRTWGPTLNLTGSFLTRSGEWTSSSAKYTRQAQLSSAVYFPFLWTYSSLTPSVALNLSRQWNYQTGSDFTQAMFLNQSTVIPSIDLVMTYFDGVNSPLAVEYEGGRLARLATRTWTAPTGLRSKLLIQEEEYIQIARHVVVTPSFKAMWSSHTGNISGSTLQGRIPQQIFESMVSDSLNQLTVRGYPGQRSQPGHFTSVPSLNLQFPLLRVFRGWGLNPLFLDDLTGHAFVESGYFTSGEGDVFLPSAGIGIQLNTEILTFPVTFTADFQQGLNSAAGGKSDLFFQVLLGALHF